MIMVLVAVFTNYDMQQPMPQPEQLTEFKLFTIQFKLGMVQPATACLGFIGFNLKL